MGYACEYPVDEDTLCAEYIKNELEGRQNDFDEVIPRKGTNCLKYDARDNIFQSAEVLPLWVADTDFRTPDFIVNAIKKRTEHEIFGYSFKPDSYYEAVIKWMKRRHNWKIKKEWISFSPGVVTGLTLAIESFSRPGDEIIVQPPVYFPFFACILNTKRKMVENPLKLVNGRYTFDLDDLKSKINNNTKLILLCSPQNPGGMVWTQEELKNLMDICLENDILILSDEIHSDLVYRRHRHIPLASISDEAAHNSIIFMSPSKTFNVAGLSTSIVIIPDQLKLKRYNFNLNTKHLGMGNIFGTVALEAAYNGGDDWLEQQIEYLWDNYIFLEKFLRKNLPHVDIMKPEATYLVWLDFQKYGMNDEELFSFITEKAKVGLSNGARFGKGGNGWMRLNIGCPRNVLTEALYRISEAFSNI
jgi:cysteine-S-conjugate beta-lyase